MTKAKRKPKPYLTKIQVAAAKKRAKEDRRIAALSPYERGYQRVVYSLHRAKVHHEILEYTIITQHKYTLLLMCRKAIAFSDYYFGVYQAIQDWLAENPNPKKTAPRRFGRDTGCGAARGKGESDG